MNNSTAQVIIPRISVDALTTKKAVQPTIHLTNVKSGAMLKLLHPVGKIKDAILRLQKQGDKFLLTIELHTASLPVTATKRSGKITHRYKETGYTSYKQDDRAEAVLPFKLVNTPSKIATATHTISFTLDKHGHVQGQLKDKTYTMLAQLLPAGRNLLFT